MNRKEELEILIADVKSKLETAGDEQQALRDAQNKRVIEFFSKFLGLPKKQLVRTSFNDYSTIVAVRLPGGTEFSSAEITIRHPRHGKKFCNLGWFSSGASMDDEDGEKNLLYLESLGKIAGDLRTGSEVHDFLMVEIEDEKISSKLTFELSIKLNELKGELSNIINQERFDKFIEMGEIEFEQGFYAGQLSDKISKLSFEKKTDKTITFKFTPINYNYSETKRLKTSEGFRLVVEAMKFIENLKAEKASV